MQPSKILVHDNKGALVDRIAHALSDQADLSRTLILTPESLAGSELRQSLLQRLPEKATLPPRNYSLRSFIERSTPSEKVILNNHARELMLVEVLRDSEKLKGKGNAWQLADELLKLFDELELSGHDSETFVQGLQNSNSQLFLDDADKVSHLWQARSMQMQAENVTDRIQIYSSGLNITEALNDYDAIIVAGFDWLQNKEISWLSQCFQSLQTTLLVATHAPLLQQLIDAQLPITTKPEATGFFDICFSPQQPLLTRSKNWQSEKEQSLDRELYLFTASSPEHEARFIDVQIRDWLSKGKENIALVTEDRQLARRVSAILQHANLTIHDDAGWPLSTTVAAGSLERWLECIENQFPYRPFLDVLKSPFIHLKENQQKDIFHFERDIIEHENIAADLANYRRAINDRATRLTNINPDYPARLLKLVDSVEKAAAPISALVTDKEKPKSFPLSKCIDALQESLDLLGLSTGLAIDTAGQRLLQEIEDMRQSEKGRNIRFNWQEFRSWLKRAMETHNFRPSREASPVRIMTLQQSLTGNFDAVILAGMDNAQLPRPPARLVFFNDQVKQQLGLQSTSIARARQFFQFRRLLESCPEVVLSYSQQAEGKPQLASPWLAKLQTFHELVFDQALPEPVLANHPDLARLSVVNPDSRSPAEPPSAPQPPQDGALVPQYLSASSHQQLIDCPYKFFAGYPLGLKAPEDIIEQLNNRDYGNYVHRCLQAFHSDIPELPGPFKLPLSDDNVEEAQKLLIDISEIVFKPDEGTDLRHINWLNMWQKVIPDYLQWQKERQTQWDILSTEQQSERPLSPHITLKGKIDRLDKGQTGNSIVDYKTGSTASKEDILNGENVQLSTYSLMASAVQETTYLSLKKQTSGKLKETTVSGETLSELQNDVEQRLVNLAHSLENSTKLPANGDENACQYCNFNGLCRKDMWMNESESLAPTQ